MTAMTDRIMVNLFELTVRPPGSGAPETLVLVDEAMRPFAHNDPDRPNQRCLNRVVDVPTWSEDLTADPARLAGGAGAGTLVLANGDQALSYLRGYAWERVVWRRGWEGLAWADWVVLLTARPQPPAWGVGDRQPARLSVTMYSLLDDLSDPVQSRTYAGSNDGTIGLECEADAKGRQVPLALGDLSNANLPAKLVNRSLRIYQVHDADAGPLAALTRVYDRGAPAAFASVGDVGTALQTVTLADTQMATDRGRGLFRLGGAVGGTVTCDALGPAAAGTTATTVAAWLLSRRYSGAAALGSGFATTTLAPAAVGVWVDGSDSYADVLARLYRSAALWCLPDPLGVWQVGRFAAPDAAGAVPAERTITANRAVRVEVDDAESVRPVWSVTVKWGVNYSPTSRDAVAGSIRDTARAEWLATASRQVVATDPAVRARWSNARAVELDTALVDGAAAQALADHVLAVFGLRPDGTPRQSLRVAVELDRYGAAVRLGDTVLLRLLEEGVDDPMVVVGRRLGSPEAHLEWLRVWG